MNAAHLAFDMGASSGRAIVGVLDGSPKRLSLSEVHRFEHLACPTPTGPVWDLTGIWHHMLTGLRKACSWCKENQAELVSVGVDGWGVDWALLGPSGELLALPHCYRDPQNELAMERVLERVGGFETLYARTGIQLMPLNTLFQVAARFEKEPRLFEAAERFVFLPDLFHFWLSGVISTERTIASTSSMLDLTTGEWDQSILETLGLPVKLFGPLVDPGTVLGTLRDQVASAAGITTPVQVITPASHDTGSAIAAVPATDQQSWAYLSSGTWSLLGAELSDPVANNLARSVPFTNERGVEGSIRLLKNIAGLWLVQELRRDFQQSGANCDFSEMVEQARQEEPFRTLVDPNFSEFSQPGDMKRKLQSFAKDSGQPVPETIGQLVRCCLESLALCYDGTLGQLERVLDRKIDVLHIVGGGIQNELLSRFTAEAIRRPVVTGPVEATAIGNLLVQSIGTGGLSGLTELREVVARSFDVTQIHADGSTKWDDARKRYNGLLTN